MTELVIRSGSSHLVIRGGPLSGIPAPPSGLNATTMSSTQINLVWADNSTNETNFVVERSPDGSVGWSRVGTPAAGATSYSDTGLAASTAYYYRVKAVNAAGSSAYSGVASATTAPAGGATVPAPTNLAVTPAGPDRVTFTMTTAGGIAYNYAQLWASPTGANTYTQVGGNLPYYGTVTAVGLQPATSYDVEVRVNGTGSYVFSPFSAPVTGVTTAAAPTTPPAAPASLTATTRSGTTIELDWTDNATTAASYTVERSLDGSTGWAAVATNLASNATTYTDTGLTNGTTYYYRVKAVNYAGASAPSNVAHDTTVVLIAPPTPPSGLAVVAMSPSSVHLTWVDNSGGTAVHIVERLDDGMAPHEVARVAPGTTAYTDADPFLFPGSTYSYQVRAYNLGGLSDPHPHPGATHYGNSVDSTPAPSLGLVTLPAAVPGSVPSTPTKASAYAADDTRVWVSWNVNDYEKAETGFTIQKSVDNGTTWATARASVPARWTGCYVSGLTAITAYRFRVASVNAAGTSAYSAPTGPVTTFAAGQNYSPTGRVPKFGHDPEWQAGMSAGLADFLTYEGYTGAGAYAAWKAAGYPMTGYSRGVPFRGPASWAGQVVGTLLGQALQTGTANESYLQTPFRAGVAYQVTGDTHFLDLAYAYWTVGNVTLGIPPFYGYTGTVTGAPTVTTVTRTDLELYYTIAVRSLAHPFTAADSGKVLTVTGGNGWSTGRVELYGTPDANGFIYIRRPPAASFATGGVGTVTSTSFTVSGLTGMNVAANYNQYKVLWDTGGNHDLSLVGQYRTLAYDGPSSTLTVIPGMPAAVAVGDTFTVFDMYYWSSNQLRNLIQDMLHTIDMMWPGLTPARQARMINHMNALADNELGHGTAGALTCMADSLDQAFGGYMGIAMIGQTGDMGNPRASALMSDTVDLNATNPGWPVGGYTPTALDRSTARNQVYSFCKGSISGEWAYSSQYNPNDAALWMTTMMALRTCADVEYFPEVAEWLVYTAADLNLSFTSDLADYASWGDDQAPNTFAKYSFVNAVSQYAGAVQRHTAVGPYFVNRIYNWWLQSGTAVDPSASGTSADSPYYAQIDFRDTGVNYRTGPNTYGGRGAHGVMHWHQNLADDTAAWFRSYTFTPSIFNHQVDWLNNWEVRFRQVRALTHPREYDDYVHEEGGVNGLLINNIDSSNESKGLIAQEFGPSGEYGYQVGSAYGWHGNSYSVPDYQQPSRVIHERTRSLFYLPASAGNCVTVVVHDRTHAQRADLSPGLSNYGIFGLSPQARLANVAALEQAVCHFAAAPTVTGNRVAWTVPAGNQYGTGGALKVDAANPGSGGFPANLDTLLPVGYVRTIGAPYPDASWTASTQGNPASFNSFVGDGTTLELKYRALITPNPPLPPNASPRFTTFLNVWQAYDPGVVTVNTLVRSSSGEAADGVLCSATGEPDKVCLFGARPLDRTFRSGFTVSWGSAAAATRIYVSDLDPAKVWHYTVDAGASTLLVPSSSRVGRVALTGSGPHTLVLIAS